MGNLIFMMNSWFSVLQKHFDQALERNFYLF